MAERAVTGRGEPGARCASPARTRCSSRPGARPSWTWSATTRRSRSRSWPPWAGGPTLMQRFPDGAHGKSFFQKRVPAGRTRLARDHRGVHAERHHQQRPGGRRPGPPALGGQPGLPGLPPLALPGRRARGDRRAAHRPRPRRPGSPSTRSARRRYEVRALLDERGHRRLREDHRQPGPAHLRAVGRRGRLLRRAAGGGRGGPRARAAPARPHHRPVVEGGAGRAGLRRLQPERPPQDGVRRLVRAAPGRRPGVVPDHVGRGGHRRPRRAHPGQRSRPSWPPRATRGRP